MAINSTAETSPSHATRKNGQVGSRRVEGQHVIGARSPDLVVERVGLHRDDEQQNERREHVDDALQARADIGVEQVDGDVGAAVARRGDAPEDQNAEQQPAEVVGIRNLHAEEVAQHDRDEDVGGDDADEAGGDQLDEVDEPVHRAARTARRRPVAGAARSATGRLSHVRS